MLKWLTGAWLMALASHATALTLGNLQGSTIIGQPMDVLVRSSISAADTVSDLCLKAEVVYGETPVSASDVSITIQRLGNQESGALRVRVRSAVNEPVVLMTLQVGCRNPFRRQYTLLADFAPPPPVADAAPVLGAPALAPAPAPVAPPAASPPASARSTPVPPPARSAQPAVVPAPVATAPAATVSPAPAALAAADDGVLPADQPETPIRLSAPAPRPANVVRLGSKYRPPAAVQAVPATVASGAVQNAPLPRIEREANAAGSRLQLDPIDLSAKPVAPVLGKASDPAATAPAAAAAPAAAPAASASPALPDASPNASPNALGAAQPNAAPADNATPAAPPVEQELAAMRQEQEKMRLALESLNAQLQQAQSDRYTNPLVMGLAGLALVLLLALVWQLGRRSRPTGPRP